MNGDDPITAAETLAANRAIESFSVDSAAATYSTALSSSNSSNSSRHEHFQSVAEFEAWLVEAAIAQYGHLFGRTTYTYSAYDLGWYGGEIFTTGQPIIMPTMRTAVANDATLAFSSTNIQVEGVDEADLVETDGEYLYIIAGQDLVIVRAGVGDDLRIVSRVHLDERPVGMYLSGDRLALVSSSESSRNRWELDIFDWYAPSQFEPPTTTVTVFDISDRATPALVQNSQMDGRLVTSRVVGDQLRLVLTNGLQLPQPIAKPLYTARQAEVAPLDSSALSAEISLAFTIWPSRWYEYGGVESMYESQEEYVARLRQEYLGLALPRLRTWNADGVSSESTLVEATDLERPESHALGSMTTIVTFDLASDEAGPVDTLSVNTGSSPQVYSTPDSVYLFAQQPWDWRNSGSHSNAETDVWKFAVDSETHAIELEAKGKFECTLLNQFAADEHDGYLRVVTSSNDWGSGGHGLQVLEQSGSHLNVVASLGGIAPDDVLYSVRFAGDRAFFVTFRKVDPLFAVDLSDPADPKLLGELHIPGYSDYLQPIDENHLLAIGRGADESTGLFQELQVSLFDVSDLSNPRLVHRYSFEGGRSTATPATGNRWTRGDGDHHAVNYFADDQILAIPIFTADDFGGFWGGIENTAMFEAGHGGLQVLRIDVGAGFTPIGLVEHETLIERSIQIGEHLFAISSGTVTAHELTDPSIELGEVSIEPDSIAPPIKPVIFVPPLRTDLVDLPEEKQNEPPEPEPVYVNLATESGNPASIEPPVIVEMVGLVTAAAGDLSKSNAEIDKRTISIERSLPHIGTPIDAVPRQSLPDVEESDEVVSTEPESKMHEITQTDLNQANAQTSDRRLGKSHYARRLQQVVEVSMAHETA
jgi:hypothetical protein